MASELLEEWGFQLCDAKTFEKTDLSGFELFHLELFLRDYPSKNKGGQSHCVHLPQLLIIALEDMFAFRVDNKVVGQGLYSIKPFHLHS